MSKEQRNIFHVDDVSLRNHGEFDKLPQHDSVILKRFGFTMVLLGNHLVPMFN